VDYNSHVKSGDLLAELDKRTLLTSLENSQASLENAKAEMTFQTANYNRIKALSDKNLVAQNDYDQSIYNFTKAQASLKMAQLDYNRAKINLNYATIYSPIDGVVLERAVDEGQTVAASFSTPTLFSIANDLTQMQVEASIDEADIGKVKIGQRVTFTVRAANPDLKLMPGMTANITDYVEEAKNVLIVSSKALHFIPDQDMVATYMKPPKDLPKNIPPHMVMDSTLKTVWVKNGSMVHPVPVKIGIDNDINAQVIHGLKEGDEVIVAVITSGNGAASAKTSSPFMPKPPSRKSNSTPPQR
jgi:HlyD family secretion protein